MGEKEKHPWKPPELAPPMPDFDDFPISAWLKTPPILPKGLCLDEKNYTATAVSSNERRNRIRMIGVEPPLFTTRLMEHERMKALNFNPEDLEVASVTEKIGKTMDKVYDAQIGLPEFITPACHDINQDIATMLDISEKAAFDISREQLLTDRGIDLPKGQKHNALYDAEVIKAIYEDFFSVGGGKTGR